MNCAFLGLGAMGYPMAGHLSRYYSTRVWNRTPTVMSDHAREFGSLPMESAPQAVKDADVVISCVPTSDVVDHLMAECMDVLKRGAVWIDCTSGRPDAARAAEARLGERGVSWLDAPVSGGPPRAQTGELTVMVGGSASALKAAQAAITPFAAKVVHVGPAGAGFAVKSVNNMMMAINLWGACEGLQALQALGVDVDTALSIINTSSGASDITQQIIGEPLKTGEFPLRFKLALLHKDARIAVDVMDGVLPTPVSALVTQLLGLARQTLPEDADFREIARVLSGR